jgi:hypothetical protein
VLQAVSKPQIAFAGKTQPDEKAQHIHLYVSILKKAVTQPPGVRWGFETACSLNARSESSVIVYRQIRLPAAPDND